MSVVAIDVGLKRIGVALGVGKVVMPQKPILRKNRNQAARELSLALCELKAEKLVVGIPIGGSSEDEMKRRIEHFVSLLEFSGEVIYIDESMSSFEASKIYTDSKRDGKLDSIAAMIILKRYLKVD